MIDGRERQHPLVGRELGGLVLGGRGQLAERGVALTGLLLGLGHQVGVGGLGQRLTAGVARHGTPAVGDRGDPAGAGGAARGVGGGERRGLVAGGEPGLLGRDDGAADGEGQDGHADQERRGRQALEQGPAGAGVLHGLASARGRGGGRGQGQLGGEVGVEGVRGPDPDRRRRSGLVMNRLVMKGGGGGYRRRDEGRSLDRTGDPATDVRRCVRGHRLLTARAATVTAMMRHEVSPGWPVGGRVQKPLAQRRGTITDMSRGPKSGTGYLWTTDAARRRQAARAVRV